MLQLAAPLWQAEPVQEMMTGTWLVLTVIGPGAVATAVVPARAVISPVRLATGAVTVGAANASTLKKYAFGELVLPARSVPLTLKTYESLDRFDSVSGDVHAANASAAVWGPNEHW